MDSKTTVAKVIPIESNEVAENDFARFVDLMDLDVDPDGMDDEDKMTFQDAKRKIMRAIKAGSLVVNEEGEILYTTTAPGDSGGKLIRFAEPDGAAIAAMDSKKRGHDIGKTYACMAAITKQSPQLFGKMKNRDIKICQAILALFLA